MLFLVHYKNLYKGMRTNYIYRVQIRQSLFVNYDDMQIRSTEL